MVPGFRMFLIIVFEVLNSFSGTEASDVGMRIFF